MEMTKEEEDYYFRTPYAKHAFEGKTAVVTGAGSGMGRATACLLAACGCTVALVDLNSVGLDDTRAMIIGRGFSAHTFVCDLARRANIDRLVRDVLGKLGNVDILINNAGVMGFSSVSDSAEDFEKAWELNFAVNVTAQVRLIRGFRDSLKRNGCGRVINIASTEGLGATLFNSPYVAAKHASVGLTKALALELGSQGITVNAVCPGPIRTGMTASIEERSKALFAKRMISLRRYGHAIEVAHATVSFVLPTNSFMNGSIIPVDGGVMAHNAMFPRRFPWEEKSLNPPCKL
jgi:3-oxoacyl-[acyl-carrier protein] reductase